MPEEKSGLVRIRQGMLAFRASFDSLHLATVSADGVPEASAAPMVLGDGGEFYIYTSGLSRHTRNLLSNPQAAVLLIEPVEAAQNAFARQRLSYQCKAVIVSRGSEPFADIMARFAQRFGDIVQTLENLPDFQLFCLTPVSGSYVRGFGQAWRLSGAGLSELEHINPAADRRG